jgi:hypothetical protein
MKDSFNLPEYKLSVYKFSTDAGYYVQNDLQTKNVPANWLPAELKREETGAATVRCKTNEVLTRIGIEKGYKKLLTGLNSTIWPNWFIGEHLRRNNGVKIKSAMLIHFVSDRSAMNIFYFTGHQVDPDEMQNFAARAIPAILKLSIAGKW